MAERVKLSAPMRQMLSALYAHEGTFFTYAEMRERFGSHYSATMRALYWRNMLWIHDNKVSLTSYGYRVVKAKLGTTVPGENL